VGKYDKSFVANTTITFEITATLTGLHHQHVSLSSRFVYLNLPKLTSLKLRECGIKSLGVDFSLPNLLVLDLNGNSLTRLSLPPSSNSGGRWKDRLPRLQRLLAARNNIGRMDDLFELAELSGLVHLELLGNPICMDRNQLNRQLIENVATTIHSATANEPSNISGKEERSISKLF
jgi:hypothetical protein